MCVFRSCPTCPNTHERALKSERQIRVCRCLIEPIPGLCRKATIQIEVYSYLRAYIVTCVLVFLLHLSVSFYSPLSNYTAVHRGTSTCAHMHTGVSPDNIFLPMHSAICYSGKSATTNRRKGRSRLGHRVLSSLKDLMGKETDQGTNFKQVSPGSYRLF